MTLLKKNKTNNNKKNNRKFWKENQIGLLDLRNIINDINNHSGWIKLLKENINVIITQLANSYEEVLGYSI